MTPETQIWVRSVTANAFSCCRPRSRHCASAFFLLMLVGSLLTGCSDSTPETPTAPARRAESLTITGATTLQESETAPLALSVRFSTGATETISQGVVWIAENPAIATVNANGVVTALAPGQGAIRATFDGVSATLKLTVTAGLTVVTGRVHESRPTEHIGVSRATLTAVDSNGTTHSATADADGNFSMRLSVGAAVFTIAAAGYDTAQIGAAIARGNSENLSLSLTPAFAELRDLHERNLAAPPTDQRTYKVAVHHPGQLTVSVTAGDLSDGWGNACVEVRDDSNALLGQAHGTFDITPSPIRVAARAGTLYEVKLLQCPTIAVPGFFVNMYRIAFEITHPR